MSDITKARFFLKQRKSAMATLETFQLMLATAESKYRSIRMRQVGNKDVPGTWETAEIEAAVDYAVLRYLKKYNHLPVEVSQILQQNVPLQKKKDLAIKWANS